jgi:hypothetical protein
MRENRKIDIRLDVSVELTVSVARGKRGSVSAVA